MPDCSINGDCNAPSDPDCLMNGCVGADGLAGTMDDSIDVTTACRHEVDQGAICYATAEPMDVITAPRCTTGGALQWFWESESGHNNAQDIAFGCIDCTPTFCRVVCCSR